jgi:Zn-dependent protease
MRVSRHYRPRMKWSVRVLRVAGIDVRVHATFVLAVVYFASGFALVHGLLGAAFGVLWLCCLFICLTLHELGHCLTARRFGVSVNEILLLPIGGVARLSSEPRKPPQELWIALAGPFVNALIALGLWLLLVHYRIALDLTDLDQLAAPSGVGLLRDLFWGNAVLALFNMLPALPMDGGRVLRATLSLALGRSRATRIAAAVGQVIAIGLVWVAFKKDWGLLALVGMFVFVGAAEERAVERASELLSQLRAGEVCDPNAVVFGPHEPVAHVLDILVRSPQAHFAVFHGQELVGTVARDRALALVAHASRTVHYRCRDATRPGSPPIAGACGPTSGRAFAHWLCRRARLRGSATHHPRRRTPGARRDPSPATGPRPGLALNPTFLTKPGVTGG